MSIERVVKHLRNIKSLVKLKLLDKELQFRIQHNHKNVIDLEDTSDEQETNQPKDEESQVVELSNVTSNTDC